MRAACMYCMKMLQTLRWTHDVECANLHSRADRWRDIVGLLCIVAGAAVFVAALAVPLDDPTLFLALVLALARHTYGRSSQTT